MTWLERFYPDVYLESAYEIDFEQLYREGYRGGYFLISIIHWYRTVRRQTGAVSNYSGGLRRSGMRVYCFPIIRNRG